MKRTSFIRLGGLAAMVGGIYWVAGTAVLSLEISSIPVSQALDILSYVFLSLGAMAAVVALHLLQRERYGLWGALFSLVAFVGLAMIIIFQVVNFMETVPSLDLPPLLELLGTLNIPGALLATVGLTGLGIVTLAARMLPWWCGVALMLGNPLSMFVVFALLEPLLWTLWVTAPTNLTKIAWAVLGMPWIVVGYAIFRAEARLLEQPSRVR